MPEIDSTKFYTYEYVKPYKGKVYYRSVKDIRLTGNKIYCLIKYDNGDNLENTRYTYVEIDRQSGKRKESAYPQHLDCNVFSRGLCTRQDDVYPFEVLKKNGKAWLRIYNKTN